MLRAAQGNHVVPLLGVTKTEKGDTMLMEIATGGSLDDEIKRTNGLSRGTFLNALLS